MSVTDTGIPDVPHSPLADTVLERLTAVHAGPGRAAGTRAHMRDVAPFLGLTSPVRRALSRTVLDGLSSPARRTAPRSRCAAGACPSASTTTSPSISCAVM